MPQLFLPAEPASSRAVAFDPQADAEVQFATRMPLYGGIELGREIYKQSQKISGLSLNLGLPQKAKGQATLLLKFSYYLRKTGAPWSGEVKFLLGSNPGEAGVQRQRTSANILDVPADDLEADIGIFEGAARMLLDPALLTDLDYGTEHLARIAMHPDLAGLIPGAIAASIEEHTSRNAAREDCLAEAQALFNKLAEGTPLIIRTNMHVPTWQLGARRGKISKPMARNIKVATLEDLWSPDLRAAGLTAHQALQLAPLAEAALAEFPEAGHFQVGSPELYQGGRLLEGRPFHPTFSPPKVKPKPEIWIQTGHSGPHLNYEISDGAPFGHRGMWTQKNRFPWSSPDGRVEVKWNDRHSHRSKPIPDFARICGMWCVSDLARGVLEAHDLGGIAFKPLEVVEADGSSHTTLRHYLAWDQPIQTLLPDLCDHNFMLGFSGTRRMQPFEVAVTAAHVGSRDLWWDDQRKGYGSGTVFMSNRLHKSLKKAKCLPAMALKPCDVR